MLRYFSLLLICLFCNHALVDSSGIFNNPWWYDYGYGDYDYGSGDYDDDWDYGYDWDYDYDWKTVRFYEQWQWGDVTIIWATFAALVFVAAATFLVAIFGTISLFIMNCTAGKRKTAIEQPKISANPPKFNYFLIV